MNLEVTRREDLSHDLLEYILLNGIDRQVSPQGLAAILGIRTQLWVYSP